MSERIGDAVTRAAGDLARSGVPESRREARLLVALAAGLDAATVLGYPERPLETAAAGRLQHMLGRRLAREPVSRVVGRREFWSLDFALTPATLDPRPDSETLVAAALERIPDRQAALSVLDLGTGSGCLLLALLSELPRAAGLGLDLAPEAAAAAHRNAKAMSLDSRTFFVVSHWGAAIGGEFDAVLANPPYVPSRTIDGLAPEVALYEPLLALDGGPDGLHAYRELAPDLGRLLKPSGFAVVEVGDGQASLAAAIFQASGLDVPVRHRDLRDIERCLVVTRR
jgi:release factor glutamine methyltransferase